MTTVTETAPIRPRSRKRIDGWRWAGRLLLLLMLFYTAMPMLWMLLTSIKSGFAAMQFPPQWWPDEPTLASYQKLLDPQNSVGQDFLHFFWNSLFVSTITTILSVIVAVPAAYAFSRFSFPGRNFLFFSVLLRNMGGDLRHLDDATLKQLTNRDLIALDQHSTDNRPHFVTDGIRVWTARGQNGETYLAVFNVTDKPKTVGLDLAQLGIARTTGRNLWTGEPVQVSDGRLNLTLAPHASLLSALGP